MTQSALYLAALLSIAIGIAHSWIGEKRLIGPLVSEQSRAGLLAKFATTIGFAESERWIERLPAAISRELRRRRYALPKKLIFRHPGREAVRMASVKSGWRVLVGHETGWASVDGIYRSLQQRSNAVTAAFNPLKESKLGELTAHFEVVLGMTPEEPERGGPGGPGGRGPGGPGRPPGR